MEKKYLIFLVGILFISGCSVSSSPNEDIKTCTFQEITSLSVSFYYDTGSMNIINGTKLYYNISKEPELNDIVIVDDSKYKHTIEGNLISGFAHRIWSIPSDKFYITKGDNNRFVDGAYKRDKIKGVIVCKE